MDWSNKEQVLEEISKKGAESFENASEELRNDFGFVLRAFALDSRILQYLKDEYKNLINKAAEVGIENMETNAYTSADVLMENYGEEWEKYAEMQEKENARWIKTVKENFKNNFMDSTTKRYILDFFKEINDNRYNASFNSKTDEAIKQWEKSCGWDEQFKEKISEDIEKCEIRDTIPEQEHNQEDLEQLSAEELENMLNSTVEDNDSKIAELENLKKKELIEKIIVAQREGQDLDRQIAEKKAKSMESK